MISPSKPRRRTAVLAVAALGGLTGWTGLAGASGQLGVSVVPGSTVTAVVNEEPIRINMRRGTEVTTRRIRVEPGGHTAWHYHPGPHVVAVATGTVKVYETDCTVRGTFAAGDGFFDPGSSRPRHIHALHNAGSGTAEVLITDFRERGQKLTIDVDPQPAACP